MNNMEVLLKTFLVSMAIFFSSTLKAQITEDDYLVANDYSFGEGWTFSGSSGYKMKISGLIQPSMDIKYFQDSILEPTTSRQRLRRLRLRINGEYEPAKIQYRIQVDLGGVPEIDNSQSTRLLHAYLTYKINRRHKLIIGQKVNPVNSREMTMNSGTLQLVDRSRLTSAFNTIFEYGLFSESTFRLSSRNYIRALTSVTSGDGDVPMQNDFGGLKYGFRIDYLPNGLFTRYGQFRQSDLVRERIPKLVFGIRGSFNQGISSRRGRAQGDIIYLDKDFLPSLPNYWQMGADFLFKFQGLSVLGEFVSSDASVPENINYRLRNDGSMSSSFLIDGNQNIESYVKNRMMIGSGYNLQAGYLLKNGISLDLRYCYLQAPEYSFLNNPTFYSRPEAISIGLSKYFSRWYGFKMQTSVTRFSVDGANSMNGEPLTKSEWLVQFITSVLI